jgi:hypothetical protein
MPTIIRSSDDTNLDRLLRCGLQGLYQENESLAAAFQPSSQPPRLFYREANQSLGYWVFETTLVYILFKAWLPTERVRWEAPYPRSRQSKADLAVYHDDKGQNARWVFEAKWWPNMSSKTQGAIRGDLNKLLRWKGTDGRLLLAFWYAPEHHRQRDIDEVDSFCQERIGGFQPRCVFAGEFPIHTKWAKHTWNFTMVAVALEDARF